MNCPSNVFALIDFSLFNTDPALLQRFSQGDQQAFASIYGQYHSLIYNYLLKFTKNPTLAEDLLHDIFLKIWDARERVDIKTSFSAYLFGLARNTVITQLNRMSLYDAIRDEMLSNAELELHPRHLMNKVEAREYEELLEKAINSLPPQRKEAFILCRQQGKTYEEAAIIMNISKNTLKQHLQLSVKSIKEYLLEHGNISLLMILVAFN
ncbi:RNA polymerase sigma factor [Pseudobacter ginsenosidimutans]|uniref:RNA polymerase sigma-70 factor (ECF subfamily) n=1 Tax=Pseudobacter ginsenosidimutans TaxID=661488 RepID=A0A4V2F105_9BACT|nr:RNA polymerase sigma-70 factor [Pseudobacter ginsenosidimutans]QEC41274.1 RNA polymerase sigma-70 factor [Pseudobacter ginsenosidimutans]RZS71951.1 RNA polymerase sigma-70 factor (ECF subfamily) [Pseudobacter ginsenosidimutans]